METREAESYGAVRVAERVPWPLVGLFVAVSFGLAWLLALPLWLGAGLRTPGFLLIGAVTMYTPTVAALVVREVGRRRGEPVRLGLRPVRSVRFTIAASLVSLVAFAALTFAGVLVSGAAGTVRLDLTRLLSADGVVGVLLMLGIAIPLGALTLGEEIGWRGWLLPALLPLGRWPALIVVGVLWGLWHAPLILLGYNYDRPNATGLLLMVGLCVLLSVLVGWARLWTGSLWPAVFGHAAVNASAGTWPTLIVAGGVVPDPATGGLLGWPGWLLVAAVIAAVAAAQAVARGRAAGPAPAPDAARSIRDA